MRSWDDTTLLNLHLFSPNLLCAWLHHKTSWMTPKNHRSHPGLNRWRGRWRIAPWEVGNSKKTAEFSWTKMRGAKVATFGKKNGVQQNNVQLCRHKSAQAPVKFLGQLRLVEDHLEGGFCWGGTATIHRNAGENPGILARKLMRCHWYNAALEQTLCPETA